jgi:hypothetical protein
VSKLAEIVDSQAIIHVCGTPASGKSILSLLLRDYFRWQGRTVFWLGAWDQKLQDFGDEDPWVNFARSIRYNYPMLDKEQNIFADNNVIILDEAQDTYRDSALWNIIIKDIVGHIRQIKICLFCSYGSPSTGLSYNADSHRALVTFSLGQRVSLLPSSEDGAPQIGLFYTKIEFEEVLTKLCTNELGNYSINPQARNYIFDLTNGHPGAVVSIAYFLFRVCAILLLCFWHAGFFNVTNTDYSSTDLK